MIDVYVTFVKSSSLDETVLFDFFQHNHKNETTLVNNVHAHWH